MEVGEEMQQLQKEEKEQEFLLEERKITRVSLGCAVHQL